MCFACELYSAATTTAQAAYDVRSGGGSYISTPPDSADGGERERDGPSASGHWAHRSSAAAATSIFTWMVVGLQRSFNAWNFRY